MDLCDNPLDSVIPFPFHIWQEITFTPKKCRYIQFFLSKAVNEKNDIFEQRGIHKPCGHGRGGGLPNVHIAT